METAPRKRGFLSLAVVERVLKKAIATVSFMADAMAAVDLHPLNLGGMGCQGKAVRFSLLFAFSSHTPGARYRGNESIYLHRSGPLLEKGRDRPKNRYGRYGFHGVYSIFISTVGVDEARVFL